MGTLTIRTTEKQDQLIEEVQNLLNESAVSKTLLHCVTNYQELLTNLDATTAKLEESVTRVHELEALITNHFQSRQALMSAVPQFTSVAPRIDNRKNKQNLSRAEAKQAIDQIKQCLSKH